VLEQDSAYGSTTTPGSQSLRFVCSPVIVHGALGIPVSTRKRTSRPYPVAWEHVAELRVFHTTPQQWDKLIGWRTDMQRKGWRLLQVSSDSGDMVAVFGRTKRELLEKEKSI
jgi:hypothetical protein